MQGFAVRPGDRLNQHDKNDASTGQRQHETTRRQQLCNQSRTHANTCRDLLRRPQASAPDADSSSWCARPATDRCRALLLLCRRRPSDRSSVVTIHSFFVILSMIHLLSASLIGCYACGPTPLGPWPISIQPRPAPSEPTRTVPVGPPWVVSCACASRLLIMHP